MKENGFTLKRARSRCDTAETITDANYADDQAVLTNTALQAECQLHKLEQTARSIGLYVNSNKAEFLCF